MTNIKPLLTYAILGGSLMTGMGNAQTCNKPLMGESTPTRDFTFSRDGKTATDTATGLMWKRCLEGQTFSDNGTPSNYLDDQCHGIASTLDWQASLHQAQIANIITDSGHNDWRIPNRQELNSIVEYCRVNPATNTEVFPGSTPYWVWSGSQAAYGANGSDVWVVFFYGGYGAWGRRDGVFRMRLVRSNQ